MHQNLTSVRYSDYVREYALNEHSITSSLQFFDPEGPKGSKGPKGPGGSKDP